MKRKEIFCFSIFSMIFIGISVARNCIFEYGHTQPFQQIDQLNQYSRVLDFVQGIVLALFLLYAGFFIAYGIRKLQLWIPVILLVVLVPYFIDFLFQPSDKSIWYLFRDKCIQALLWVAAMRIYFVASKKIKKET